MRAVGSVAIDILREAAHRRWFLALGIFATLLLALLSFALRIDVADGAMAAIRIFGDLEGDRHLGKFIPKVFEGATYLIFYGGMIFGILACSDFATSLLAPGRIEHLLSFPIRRWELLLGTWLGVLLLAGAFFLYGAAGVAVILGAKSGLWSLKPLLGASLAALAFPSLYAAMLATTVFVRSAAIAAGSGFSLFVAGLVAGQREDILKHLEPGVSRALFEGITALLPRFSQLGRFAGSIAAGEPVDGAALLGAVGGTLLFGAAAFAVAVWRFEGRDA